jgi:hypothetical protein
MQVCAAVKIPRPARGMDHWGCLPCLPAKGVKLKHCQTCVEETHSNKYTSFIFLIFQVCYVECKVFPCRPIGPIKVQAYVSPFCGAAPAFYKFLAYVSILHHFD